MARIASLVVLGWGVLPAALIFGFSDDNGSATRTFSNTYAVTNSSILVTCTFTNGSTNTLRGFFFDEEVPTSLTITSISVTLNERNVTNYFFESGQDGDVFAGYTPFRWVLETPTNFTQTNPVPPHGQVQITYSLTCPWPESFSLEPLDWADYWPPGTNAGFGYSEATNQQVLSFLVTTNQPVLLAHYSTNGYVVSLLGAVGATYVLDVSSNLLTWVPLVTNVSSFSFTNTITSPGRAFYRGRMPVGP